MQHGHVVVAYFQTRLKSGFGFESAKTPNIDQYGHVRVIDKVAASRRGNAPTVAGADQGAT